MQIWKYWDLQANEVSSLAVCVSGWLNSFVFFAIVLVLMCVVARVYRIFLLIVYFSGYSHSFSSTCALYSNTSQIIIHLATNSAVNQAVVTFALCPRSRQLMMQNGLLWITNSLDLFRPHIYLISEMPFIPKIDEADRKNQPCCVIETEKEKDSSNKKRKFTDVLVEL